MNTELSSLFHIASTSLRSELSAYRKGADPDANARGATDHVMSVLARRHNRMAALERRCFAEFVFTVIDLRTDPCVVTCNAANDWLALSGEVVRNGGFNDESVQPLLCGFTPGGGEVQP